MILTPAQQLLKPRRRSRAIWVGPVQVGGGAPIAVQSMTNTDTCQVDLTLAQIQALAQAGCEIIRVAVRNEKALVAFKEIAAASSLPVIADIHFSPKLAIGSLEVGAAAVRINPGNLGGVEPTQMVVSACRQLGKSLRLGINAGSLEADLAQQYGGPTPEALVASARRWIRQLEDWNFTDFKVSLKSSSVLDTVAAYRLLAAEVDYPLHVGVTEAGGLYAGTVKSALGIGWLLAEGIGDTIRVSLTRDPLEEVKVAYEILRALDLRHRGPEIISCPTCGRCQINLFQLAEEAERRLFPITRPIKVAIMGCEVNGPGEARQADLGIAGGKGFGILFRKGEVIRKVPENELLKTLLLEVAALTGETPDLSGL